MSPQSLNSHLERENLCKMSNQTSTSTIECEYVKQMFDKYKTIKRETLSY